MKKNSKITAWLASQIQPVRTLYIGLTASLLYACMYGVRKSFSVAEYQGLIFNGLDFKTILVISQVIGYALSKFIGIKVISELKRNIRPLLILSLTGLAEISLVLFSLFPAPYSAIFLFFNGLPLGMIWGLVFSYLEGRKTTEILGTMLSVSFIVSSGFVKSIGKILMKGLHLSDFQMPWVVGLAFYIPLIFLVLLLEQSPDPTPEDIKKRVERVPMNKKLRSKIFKEYATGLIVLIIAYILLTVFRDLRDNFAVDIWKSIGYDKNPLIYTISEFPITLIVFLIMSSMMFVTDNKKALLYNNIIVASGFIIIGLGTLLLTFHLISPAIWMIMLGLGTYTGYLPFNCLIFDRMIAAFGTAANAGFFIYLADSFGYLGSVATLMFKNFFNNSLSWYSFLVTSSYGIAITGFILIAFATIYFISKFNQQNSLQVTLTTSKAII
jgi:hypothetical protein